MPTPSDIDPSPEGALPEPHAGMAPASGPASSADGQVDVLVIGGGINGTGIARDLAGRGWSVVLCEQHDLAQHTSSASTKLIHGGLRYLEYGHLGLVRKALIEREGLLRSAPHIMWPLRFVLPHDAGMRPAWMIRLGLWLYDHLAPRDFLPGTEHLHQVSVQARLVINAAGPWAEQVQGWLESPSPSASGAVAPASPRAGAKPAHRLRLVKGSHIVVPRLFTHDHAYIFQGRDRRIVFAIPYEQRFTLIGTTDVEYTGDPGEVGIDEAEVAYLCEAASRYFVRPVQREDVVWTYAGVRPLMDDAQGNASAVTRDYRFERRGGAAPWISVWGGKITTFRKLAEQCGALVGELLGDHRKPWTRGAVLPGGRLLDLIEEEVDPVTDMAEFQQRLRQRHPWMDLALLRRWSRQYGSQALRLVEGVTSRADLGAEVAPDLYEAELFHLRRQEWACTGDDVLWRRTKLGLHLDEAQRAAVRQWMAAQP
ncbi:MAG: glycerol-3-phosphate dehydrogenase [Rubrivivax sp.]|nr:MAG: glycerol-3-phosphate dehydrogenase [Rubrivivax sp.]